MITITIEETPKGLEVIVPNLETVPTDKEIAVGDIILDFLGVQADAVKYNPTKDEVELMRAAHRGLLLNAMEKPNTLRVVDGGADDN